MLSGILPCRRDEQGKRQSRCRSSRLHISENDDPSMVQSDRTCNWRRLEQAAASWHSYFLRRRFLVFLWDALREAAVF
jgi:hypothetical protein